MADAAHYFYADPTHAINVPTQFADLMTEAVRSALPELLAAFESLDWSREAIGAAIKSVAAKRGLKTSQLMMAARALVTGEPQTPPIDAVLALLGRQARSIACVEDLPGKKHRLCATTGSGKMVIS